MNPNKRLRLAREKSQSGLDALNAARYQQAVDDSLEAAKLWKGLRREEQNYAGCLVNAAIALDELGRYTEAKNLLEKVIPLQKKILGEEHPDVATSLNNLAIIYKALGEYETARELHEKVLGIRGKILGSEHPDTASSLNNLADIHHVLGNYEKARELHEKAFAIREKILGSEHPHTAVSLNNLALIYKAFGEYERAKDFHEKALIIQEKIFGSNALHPDVARSLNNLAVVYEAQGEMAKAQDYFQRAQTIINQVFDENHPAAQQISQNYLQLQQTIAELERRNIEQRIALEEANKLNYLGLMATGIAHNINNPVGIIRLAAQRGLHKLETGIGVVEGQEIFQRILRQADRLHDIIQGFRKFAHGDRQRRETVELNALVIEIQEYFSSQLEAHHITLKLELSDENPCSHANRFVLQEVLMNLIQNAREALEHTPDAFVIIKTWQQAEKVGLYIEDNGAGIPSAQQKNLFTPFHSTKTDGTGLGLYFANKALADLHGTIIYQERQPNGACFKIELPPVQENEHENNSLSNFSG